MRWTLGFSASAGGAALAVVTLLLAQREPQSSIAYGSSLALTLQTVAGGALVAAGVLVWLFRDGRTAGALLAAAGLAVDLHALPLPAAGGALTFTSALVLAWTPAILAAAGVFLQGGRLSRLERSLLFATGGVCWVWGGLLPTLLFDPDMTGCFGCPQNLLLVYGDEHLRSHVLVSGLRVSSALCALLGLALILRVTKVLAYWPTSIAFWGAAAALLASAMEFGHRSASAAAATDIVSRASWAATCAALIAVAAAPVVDIGRAWFESARIVEAVLEAVPSLDRLRGTLAEIAGDRSLTINFPGSLDDSGAVEGVTNVVRSGEVVAQLRHRQLPAHAARRLRDAVRAAGLMIEYTAARVRLRATLDELTASRARIVEVADSERRRLERNLHDGAQQRLIALSIALAGEASGASSEARSEVLAALEDLRTLANGIHPASLSEGGIVSSVRELADTARVPLRLNIRRLERLPAPVEAAAHRVIADCVRASERALGGAVAVELAMSEHHLSAHVRLPGVSFAAALLALEHASDRVAAVGGRLDVSDEGGASVVELRL